eukprot:m51a1_g6461 hypothetical protein (227) ;mRNA; f:22595-23379
MSLSRATPIIAVTPADHVPATPSPDPASSAVSAASTVALEQFARKSTAASAPASASPTTSAASASAATAAAAAPSPASLSLLSPEPTRSPPSSSPAASAAGLQLPGAVPLSPQSSAAARRSVLIARAVADAADASAQLEGARVAAEMPASVELVVQQEALAAVRAARERYAAQRMPDGGVHVSRARQRELALAQSLARLRETCAVGADVAARGAASSSVTRSFMEL